MTSPRGGLPTGTSNFSQQPPKILLIFGTRPEAVKLCPLIPALRQRGITPVVCVTGQHRHLLDQVLSAFRIKPDFDLNVMQSGQSLTSALARVMTGLERVINEVRPSLAVVQGDTTTTLGGALASFHARVPVAHVEAGLRTYDFGEPFPEEMNRVTASKLAALHFAVTEQGARNLQREGIAGEHIFVTGNTSIDAVLQIQARLEAEELPRPALRFDPRKKLIVVTAHRRENLGQGIEGICEAVRRLAARGDVEIAWPFHPNPRIRNIVQQKLASVRHVSLLEALDYAPFVDLMRRAYLLMTDSGGVQEEASALGKPALILREKTERFEVVTAGTAKLVGTDADRIANAAAQVLDCPATHSRMAKRVSLYGDGQASKRIAARIAAYLRRETRLASTGAA